MTKFVDKTIAQIRAFVNEYDHLRETSELNSEDIEKIEACNDSIKKKLDKVLGQQVPNFSKDEMWEYLEFLKEIEDRVDKKIYLSCIDALIKKDKKDRKALLFKARYLLDQGKYSPTITLCNRIIKSNPNDDEAYFLKGKSICYKAENKVLRQETIEGLQSINKAIELNPKDPEYWDIKESYLSDFETCETHKDSYVHLKGAYLEFYNEYHQLLVDRANCFQNMIDLGSKTIGTDAYKGPLNETKLSLYCYLLDKLGRYQDALKHLALQEILEIAETKRLYSDDEEELNQHLDENRCEILDRRASLLESLGKPEEALKNKELHMEGAENFFNSYQESLLFFDDLVDPVKHAKLLRIAGREEEAMEIFEDTYHQYIEENDTKSYFEFNFLESIGLYDEALKANAIMCEGSSEYDRTRRLEQLNNNKQMYQPSKSWENRIRQKFDLQKFEIYQVEVPAIKPSNASQSKKSESDLNLKPLFENGLKTDEENATKIDETKKEPSFFKKTIKTFIAGRNSKSAETETQKYGLHEEDFN